MIGLAPPVLPLIRLFAEPRRRGGPFPVLPQFDFDAVAAFSREGDPGSGLLSIQQKAEDAVSRSFEMDLQKCSSRIHAIQMELSPVGRQIRMKLQSVFRESQSENCVMNGGKDRSCAPVLMFLAG